VDAAAVAYLPSALLDETGRNAEASVERWSDGLPIFSGVYTTQLGRIGMLLLPLVEGQIYRSKEQLVSLISKALVMARQLGARTVSLTGLLASATNYARRLPQVTTGHATTAGAVVLAIAHLLEVVGRNLANERVALVGLGSVGLSSLRLMLRHLPHPAELLLCDVYDKRVQLEALARKLSSEAAYGGRVQVVASRGQAAAEIYDATLIVGATNVPDVLDVTRVRPGTLIVDDSAPHCGVLRGQEPIHQLWYLPQAARQYLDRGRASGLIRQASYEITGCVLSSLLSTRFAELSPTIGLASGEVCARHLQALNAFGFSASDPACGGYVPSAEVVRTFRSRFGS
jgi:hypothetical protein